MGLFCGKCTSPARLDGKTAIITGSNTGIGKITVKDFFERGNLFMNSNGIQDFAFNLIKNITGARVVMACRNIEKATEAANEIKQLCKDKNNLGEIVVTELDLSNLTSVRNCARYLMENEKNIDLLINNAGVMMCPKTFTVDGYELQFATNHLGHFLLTLLLLPKIIQSTPARIVNVSSRAHESKPSF